MLDQNPKCQCGCTLDVPISEPFHAEDLIPSYSNGEKNEDGKKQKSLTVTIRLSVAWLISGSIRL